ncbi:MAG: sodium:solute symporter family protein [Clostridia bacterium]|nr:sodium:solute symporter family protein [Clostridia bacterium]
MNIYLIGIIISMLLYVVIGFAISRRVKNANDFFVAGRQAPTILIVGSLVASYCSTGLFMGDVGEAYSGLFSPFMMTVMMLVGGYVLGSVFFGKYLRRSEAVTIPEFFGRRFNSKPLRILAAVTAIITMTVYTLSVMQGIGTLMNYVTGIDYNLCVLLALITFAILTITSGAKGVLITDTLMFSIFTVASLISVGIIVVKLGGWNVAIENITKIDQALLSWSGDLNYLYPTGTENMVWAIMTGLTWTAVCAVAPWQSSRYLMAKNEHVVIRSSVWAAFFVAALEFFIPTTGALLKVYSDVIPSPVHSMIWGVMNFVPTVIGVVAITGVLAAGISSATTFLSLISSSITNDILDLNDDKKKMRYGRIAILVVCLLVMILAYFNPPQIYVILLLSGTVVVCSWFPVCIASVWSKRVTKTGAFAGMLCGFLGCATMKIISAVFGVSLPIYLDSFVIGLIANILGLVIGSVLTQPTNEEKAVREKLFEVPERELDPTEQKKTKRALIGFMAFGILVTVAMIVLWVIPYHNAL